MSLTDNLKDIKFAPKSFGLAIATVCANAEIKFFTPVTQGNLKDWQEYFGVIKTRANNIEGCNCVEWGTAFDEPIMVAVGCEEVLNS